MNQYIFTWCPIEVVLDRRLTLIETRVLMALFSFRNKATAVCCVRRETISERCGYSQQTISRTTSSLMHKGWLEKEGKGGFSKATNYTITVPELETVSDPATVSDPGTTTVSDPGTTTVSDPDTPIRTELELSKNIKDTCTKPAGSVRATSADFERFWKHWPIKINKLKAKTAFMRKKLELNDVDELITDITNRMKSDKKWIGGFIPHCSTYLNGERWEDDYGR